MIIGRHVISFNQTKPWYFYKMVTQNALRTCKGNQPFMNINFRFVSAVDFINRSNYKFYSTRAHLFLSKHLLYEPQSVLFARLVSLGLSSRPLENTQLMMFLVPFSVLVLNPALVLTSVIVLVVLIVPSVPTQRLSIRKPANGRVAWQRNT